MKLSYKIFAIYFLVSLVLLFAVFATIRLYTTRHFKELDAIMEKEIVTVLTYELALVYQKSGSWQQFKGNKDAFRQFVMMTWQKNRHGVQPGGNMPFLHRISLYSPGKIKIAGPPFENSPSKFKPVTVDGDAVGWIGISDAKPPPHMHTDFLKTRLKVFYTIGIILFLIAAAVSYLLSRSILSPVDQLTRGTRELTQFKFDARIKVKSGDELGQLAENFNQMAATLERYEQIKKQWIVDISHELRTPLTILKGEIEALQDGVRELTIEELVSIHSEVTHLERLVNDLHFLSIADAKELKLKKRKIKPVRILNSVLGTFESPLVKERLALKVITDTQEASITGDESSLRRLFSNILENNIKYTSKPGLITVRSRVKNKVLEISIEDTGPGVPVSSQEKIFDRLYRDEYSRNRDSGGSGLGLAICKAIMMNHGGEINATDSENGGLKINIRFPVVDG